MSLATAFLRMLTVAVLAAGLGLPAADFSPAQMQNAHLHVVHHAHGTASTMPTDEVCRQHCLGVTMLVTPAATGSLDWRFAPIHVVALEVDEPSLWPQPEEHPPRA